MRMTAEPFSSFLETKRIFSGKRSQGREGPRVPEGAWLVSQSSSLTSGNFVPVSEDLQDACPIMERDR